MKSTKKFLIALGFLFAFSSIISISLGFFTSNNNESSEYSDAMNIYSENLKFSKISGPIYINDNNPSFNWSVAKSAGKCTGNGTFSEPYVIEDYVIDIGGFESGIVIENSDVYFRIENCTVYNSGVITEAGIKLYEVNNGKIIDNICYLNNIGISLIHYSTNNTISGNTVNNNDLGIVLDYSSNNNISGNTATNNYRGIVLDYSSNSYVLGNTLNNNDYGIFTYGVFNTILGNSAINNDYGIYLYFGSDNYISDTAASYNDYGVYLHKSDYNRIMENTVINNTYGMYLYESDFNNVTGNALIGNTECIAEKEGEGNRFSDNGSCTYGEGDDKIPGYNIFFLLGTLSIIAIFIKKKVNKSLNTNNFKN